MRFDEKIRLLRHARGLSQEQFAELCTVSRQSVAKWESGSVLPEPDRLPLISDILHVTLDVLLRDEMEPDAVQPEHICGSLHASSQTGRFTGILIKESIAYEDILDAVSVHKTELWRTDGSPRYWTALYFSSDAPDFPQRLSRALLPPSQSESPWFCDFRAGKTKYIVFHDHILTYRIGDAADRTRVVAECAALGIPAHQTHWED